MAANVVKCEFVRRLFILVMAVTLGRAGTSPAFGFRRCFHPIGSDVLPQRCAFNCDDMNMDAGCTRVAAAENTSCCFVSGLPAQESPFVVSASTVAPAPTAAPVSVSDIPRVRTVPPDILRHDFSPPASQSRLSIFLI